MIDDRVLLAFEGGVYLFFLMFHLAKKCSCFENLSLETSEGRESFGQV